MNVLIVNQSSARVPRKFIQQWLELLVKEFRRQKIMTAEFAQRELSLVFLDEKPAREINFQFRNKDYATDILSFDSMDPSSMGELILCSAVLRRQAQEIGLTYQEELGYMLLHGVLHLLGYDHETNAKDAAEMYGIQDGAFEKLLKKIQKN